jgi:hypothetical protein
LTSIGAGVQSFALPLGTSAELTIVSPDRREAAIVATMVPEPELRNGATLTLQVTDASRAHREHLIRNAGPVRLPVELNRGLNHVLLTPVATATSAPHPTVPEYEQILIVPSLTIAARY